MNNCGIYKITNIVNGKFYIGQTIKLDHRKSQHFSLLRKNKHYNKHLQFAYNLYGSENFIFSVVLYCDPQMLTYYEQTLVDAFCPEYNLLTDCVDSSKGYKFGSPSEEVIRKRTEPRIGQKRQPFTEEWKIKQSESHKGLHLGQNIRDLTGMIFGKLTVIKLSHVKNYKAYWLCKCGECGKENTVRGDALTTGNTKSCCGRRGYKKALESIQDNNYSPFYTDLVN